MSSQPSAPFKQKCFSSLVKWKTSPLNKSRVQGGGRTDVHSAACLDGTPSQWWNGSETSTGLLTAFVRWEIQIFPRQKLLFTKIVWQIFTANSIFAKTWLNYSCWIYITLQVFFPFPRKSLFFLIPYAPCTSVKVGGEQLDLGLYVPASTDSITLLHCPLLPGLLSWVPVVAVPTAPLCVHSPQCCPPQLWSPKSLPRV